jgi:hypothetical protein
MQMSDVTTAIIVLVVVAVIVSVIWYYPRARSILQKWASENGYHLLDYEYRTLLKGPFFWSSRAQVVYRVTVLDQQGNKCKGWVKCGNFWFGLLCDEVESRWDD